MAEKQVSRPSKLKSGESTDVEEDVMEVDEGTGSVVMTPDETADTGKATLATVDTGKATVATEKSPEESDATTSGIEMKFQTPDETPSGMEMKFQTPDETPARIEVLPLIPTSQTTAPPLASTTTTSSVESPHKKSSKTSIAGAIRKMISPNKKEKLKGEDSLSPKEKGKSGIISRLESAFKSSKSMSPPDRSMDTAIPEEDTTEATKTDTQAATGDQETSPSVPGSSTQKKSHKKLGTKLKKSLSSVAGFFTGNKGSATAAVQDEVGLVVDSEGAGMRTPEEAVPTVKVEEAPAEPDKEVGNADRKQSLKTFLAGSLGSPRGYRASFPSQPDSTLNTLLTDVPSIGSDVFTSDDNSSSKDVPSATSDKSDQEAVDSDEKTAMKRQADTPPEVLMQEEGTDTIASPFKKSNVSQSERRPSEEAEGETQAPEKDTVGESAEDKMEQDP